MELNKLFNSKKMTLGSVESFTGGLFASSIVDISGASSFFKGALVTYATEEKIRLLGISKKIIDTYGVVSEEISKEMALKGKEILNVDYCISFTGNAGPLAMENKPVGLIYISIAYKDEVITHKLKLTGDRESIRKAAIRKAKAYLIKMLKQ